ncbi:hypothetical protein BS78_01G163900 [Paspalum vaginatum]|nr:hypothetical protein BS78_01G163900 [Paspalum vaginatum]
MQLLKEARRRWRGRPSGVEARTAVARRGGEVKGAVRLYRERSEVGRIRQGSCLDQGKAADPARWAEADPARGCQWEARGQGRRQSRGGISGEAVGRRRSERRAAAGGHDGKNGSCGDGQRAAAGGRAAEGRRRAEAGRVGRRRAVWQRREETVAAGRTGGGGASVVRLLTGCGGGAAAHRCRGERRRWQGCSGGDERVGRQRNRVRAQLGIVQGNKHNLS